MHAGIHPTGADTPLPLGADTPPPSRHPLGADTPQSRHPPWEQTPPRSRHPPSLGTDTPRSDTPPPPGADTTPHRACWEIRSTRGRYASYWNAILFFVEVSKSESLKCCYQSMSGPVQYEKISGSLACWCITDSLSHTTYVETNKIARA